MLLTQHAHLARLGSRCLFSTISQVRKGVVYHAGQQASRACHEQQQRDNYETAAQILKSRKWPFIGGMAVAMVAGLYVATYLKSKEPAHCVDPREFDRTLDWEERLTGITSLRKKLAAQATGNVLETAIGTGRNFALYNWGSLIQSQEMPSVPVSSRITSFTGLDISPEMLNISVEKLDTVLPQHLRNTDENVLSSNIARDTKMKSYLNGKLRLLQHDSQDEIALPISSGGQRLAKYDTIIQTFGLCCISNPARAIEVMAAALKPGTGRIILLEHGRGWPVINGILDRNAAAHFQHYGCHYNRDIEGIVRAVAAKTPGLVVDKIERPLFWQLGTLIWIELRVRD